MVIVGYGKYRNYRIQEVPDGFLDELAGRYALSHEAQTGSRYLELQLTIAIHEEVLRRRNGGSAEAREPTAKELAVKLITKGFQSLSKDHHPDRGGSNAAQKTLNLVRAQLVRACDEIEDHEADGALVVPDPSAAPGPITDEDIPF